MQSVLYLKIKLLNRIGLIIPKSLLQIQTHSMANQETKQFYRYIIYLQKIYFSLAHCYVNLLSLIHLT